jgi:hypothetical protein
MELIPLACEQDIRLTRQVKAGGCVSELPPRMLEQVRSWAPHGSPEIELR